VRRVLFVPLHNISRNTLTTHDADLDALDASEFGPHRAHTSLFGYEFVDVSDRILHSRDIIVCEIRPFDRQQKSVRHSWINSLYIASRYACAVCASCDELSSIFD